METKAPQLRSRDVALAIVRDVFGPSRRGAQEALSYRVRRAALPPRDVAFVAELAYGTIKMRRALDWYLRPYVGERAHPVPQAIAEALRIGAYQVRYMSGVDNHAAVYETVGAALRVGHRGTAGLVNAVLRRLVAQSPRAPQRDDFANEDDYLGTCFSVPTWLAQQWRQRFRERALEALAGIDEAPQLAVRVNTLHCDVPNAARDLRDRGAATVPSPFVRDVLIAERPETALSDDPDGRWVLQGEASSMPVDVLDPTPGESVADLCSGRGNKALHIAARLGDSGTVTCVEKDQRRVRLLQERAAAAAAGVLSIVHGDARIPHGGPHDAVLLDAPCSALGVIGRYPEARWRKRADDGARFSQMQGALLRAAAESTRLGGRLVYSVCTTDVRECESVLDAFLSDVPGFEPGVIPERYAAFANRQGEIVVPPGIEGRDGFYIALLRRRMGA